MYLSAVLCLAEAATVVQRGFVMVLADERLHYSSTDTRVFVIQ